MFKAVETWLMLHTKSHDQKVKFAKILSGFFLFILGVITFIRYELIKNAGEQAEIQNVLTKDDQADAKVATEVKDLDTQVTVHLDTAVVAENNADAAAKAAVQIDVSHKDDAAVINSINSWADVDSKIK